MYIATRANVRVAYMAYEYGKKHDSEKQYSEAFNVAFKGGCVMGFCLVSLALAILTFVIIAFSSYLGPEDAESYTRMFEFIAGYGLGGSTVALFCRVGGGIYTKAADVGADLVGKVVMELKEDSPDNPATIADNVGDNVGDIAGMGSDLFGSFAESTCAALVVSGTSNELISGANFLFPLIISSVGILVCIVTSFFATDIMKVTNASKIESTLQYQLWISSILLTPSIIYATLKILPATFSFNSWDVNKAPLVAHNWGVIVCLLCGLWAGLLIGFVTDYFTSNKHAYL
jgi:Na+/H+-translocating membrane pyrophosphatase